VPAEDSKTADRALPPWVGENRVAQGSANPAAFDDRSAVASPCHLPGENFPSLSATQNEDVESLRMHGICSHWGLAKSWQLRGRQYSDHSGGIWGN
jgi:hypothetical protein